MFFGKASVWRLPANLSLKAKFMENENFEENAERKRGIFETKEREQEYYDKAAEIINGVRKKLKKANEKEYKKLVNFIEECLERGEKPVDILEPMTVKFKDFFPNNEDDLIKLLFIYIREKKQLAKERGFSTYKKEEDNWRVVEEFREKYKNLVDCDELCEDLKRYYYILKEIEKKEGEEVMLAESKKYFDDIIFKCQKINPKDLEPFMRVVLADPEKYSQRRKKKEELQNNQ